MTGGSTWSTRSMGPARRGDAFQLLGFDDEPLDEDPDEPFEESVELLDDEVDPDVSDEVLVDELPDVDAESELDEPESPSLLVVDVEAAVFLPRLSVLKKPDPLKLTPTGVKTFFTARTSPLSGWAIAVRGSSWKP